MGKLCVCREYEGMFTEGFKYVESLEKHDAKVRADVLDEFRKRINDYLTESTDFADFVVTDAAIDCVIEQMKGERND